MIHFKEFRLLMWPTSDFSSTIYYVVEKRKIQTNDTVFLYNEGTIHVIGELTRSSGHLGYYSDKGEWFYKDQEHTIIVATSNEEITSAPKIDKISLDMSHRIENGKVYLEIVKNENGNIRLPGYSDTFSIKTNPFDNHSVSIKAGIKHQFQYCI